MIIKAVHVRNFRCILGETLECEPLTALVGANGVGKSSFLRALELFYATSPRFTQEDFYNRDINQDIEIGVTFTELEEEATKRFAAYLDGNELTVTRMLSLRDGRPSHKLHGARLQNPDFVAVRGAGGARDITRSYTEELRNNPKYAVLPAARSQDAALDAMRQWELDHPEECTSQRDDGQFFGFTEVGQGYLGRFTRYIPIPAVRDAAEDATEGRGRPITEILDLVIRATLVNRDEFKALKTQAQTRYDEIMETGTERELSELQGMLASTLKTYVPDAAVELQWITEGGIEISMPKADVKLVEHGYGTAVARVGHGLQRAFILTMLQHLAAAQVETTTNADGGEDSPFVMPSLVLGIEEPELYQHPNRQRHLANILLRLASGTVPGVATRTQVIYTTHSPLFVGIDRFDQVRVLRKVPGESGMPKATKVMKVKGETFAEALWRACDGKDRNGHPVPPYTWETLKGRLHSIMTPWVSEGFFADVVCLVEGEQDRAAILGTALATGHDFESQGISVIPAGGKNNLDRPYIIFQKFAIPVYVVWDNDRQANGARPRDNHILLRLVGEEAADWPCGVYDRFACFDNKLEDAVKNELGTEMFNAIVLQLQDSFDYSNKEDALKNPYLFHELLVRARGQGTSSSSLESIVDRVLKLKAES